jgi:4-aminobutyrate aminotransferase-like enzyme
VATAQELGMIILSTGRQGLRFRPALNLTTEDLDLGVELLRQSIKTAIEAGRPVGV